MATKKYQITQLQNDDSLLVLHPETDADIVAVATGTGKYEGQATNVQDALEEVYGMALTGGVTGVKGDSEVSYRTGDVNITKANIGLGNVTNDKQVKATSSAVVGNNIVLFDGTTGDAVKDSGKAIVTTAPDGNSTDNQIPTAKAVFTAIDNLPEPMIFKGSLGTGGTITTLPSASASNEGFVYKVIEAGTYQSLVCKVGDTVISNGSEWVLIPSGDEPSGTVTSVGGQGASGSHLNVSGSPITSSGTLEIGVDSGYSIPSDTKQGQWDAKYDKPANGIPKTDLESAVQTSLGKADSSLQENQTITLSGDATGSGKTSIAVTLANSGVTAGTYSAVTVNAKGLVTAGAQLIEVGTSGQTTPSNSLAVGGIFFKEL